MAKKKSRASKVSMGGRQKRNVAREEKRQARFAAKREAGKAYEYKPISAKPGSKAWKEEKAIRAEKAKSSKLPYARIKSAFAKLDNEMAKRQEAAKNK